MPKNRRTAKLYRRTNFLKSSKDLNQKQIIQINKENNLSDSSNDSLIDYMKIEVKEEQLENQEIHEEIPFKLEKIEYSSIEDEEVQVKSNLITDTNTELNVLLEWALNLQFEHSKNCKGRLYPSKEIFDSLTCKIVVLYCTICKKRMLHTLKDWATF